MIDDENNSANIEWEQKKAPDSNTRISRRIDVRKALEAEAKDRKNFTSTSRQIKNLPSGLRKLRSKIKDVYDEDEDEEEGEIIFHFAMENENVSLLGALKDDEKAELQAKQIIENQKMQQTAGKMEALAKADKMSKQIGLKGLNRRIINDGIQDIAQGAETFDNAIKQNVADKTKIKIDPQRLSTNDTANMVKGLKKVHKTAAVTKQTQNVFLDDMKAADLIEIGKKRDVQKTAEIILEKSGRKDAKTLEKKKKREKEKQQIKTALKETKVRS